MLQPSIKTQTRQLKIGMSDEWTKMNKKKSKLVQIKPSWFIGKTMKLSTYLSLESTYRRKPVQYDLVGNRTPARLHMALSQADLHMLAIAPCTTLSQHQLHKQHVEFKIIEQITEIFISKSRIWCPIWGTNTTGKQLHMVNPFNNRKITFSGAGSVPAILRSSHFVNTYTQRRSLILQTLPVQINSQQNKNRKISLHTKSTSSEAFT